MKRIFTLLVAVGMLTMAQAQPGTRNSRQNDQRTDQRNDDRNDRWDDDDGYSTIRSNDHNSFDKNIRFESRFAAERRMKIEIAEINREYSYKIQRVKNNYRLFRFEKQRRISFLERQRQWEINKVYEYFNNRFNKYDRNDHGHTENRRY